MGPSSLKFRIYRGTQGVFGASKGMSDWRGPKDYKISTVGALKAAKGPEESKLRHSDLSMRFARR